MKRKIPIIFFASLVLGTLVYFCFCFYIDYQNARLNRELVGSPKTMSLQNGKKSFGSRIPALKEKNSECVGIVYIEGTQVNYPVLQTQKEEGMYYMNHNFYREESKSGAIFLNKDCKILEEPKNLILYGHSMRNGQMFGELKGYASKEFLKEHPYIFLETEESLNKYEIVSVIVLNADDPEGKKLASFIEGTPKETAEAVTSMESMDLYDTGVTYGEEDSFLTLIRCDYTVDDGRMLVIGKQVENESYR